MVLAFTKVNTNNNKFVEITFTGTNTANNTAEWFEVTFPANRSVKDIVVYIAKILGSKSSTVTISGSSADAAGVFTGKWENTVAVNFTSAAAQFVRPFIPSSNFRNIIQYTNHTIKIGIETTENTDPIKGWIQFILI